MAQIGNRNIIARQAVQRPQQWKNGAADYFDEVLLDDDSTWFNCKKCVNEYFAEAKYAALHWRHKHSGIPYHRRGMKPKKSYVQLEVINNTDTPRTNNQTSHDAILILIEELKQLHTILGESIDQLDDYTIWQQRALTAERKLNQLHNVLDTDT